jgi:hypothetical protein
MDGQAQVKILDMNGRLVAEKLADLITGKNIITLDGLQNLATGIYSVQLTDLESNVKTYFKVTKE